jgi:hypothetical protein
MSRIQFYGKVGFHTEENLSPSQSSHGEIVSARSRLGAKMRAEHDGTKIGFCRLGDPAYLD